MTATYPKYLAEEERKAIRIRRKRAKVARDQTKDVGLAFSGGGIRSATFNLGVLQALARAQLLRRIDFLSTVSGGGYIGSFLGRWLTRPGVRIRDVETQLNLRSPQMRWIRRHSNYLAPYGARDVWINAANYIRSISTMHLVLMIFFLAFFGVIGALRFGLLPWLGQSAPDRIPFPGETLTPWFDVVAQKFPALRGFYPTSFRWPGLEDLPITHLIVSVAPALRSPWLVLLDGIVLFGALPLWGAFWLRSGENGRTNLAAGVFAIVIAVSLLILRHDDDHRPLYGLFALFLTWLWGALAVKLVGRQNSLGIDDPLVGNLVRNKLSRYFALSLRVGALIVGVLLVDAAGDLLAQRAQGDQQIAQWFGRIAALLALSFPLLKILADRVSDTAQGNEKLRSWLRLQIGRLVIVMLVLIPLIAVAFAVHLAYSPAAPPYCGAILTGIAVLLSLVLQFPSAVEFINRSSIQSSYGARLVRAFLGASNSHRWSQQYPNPQLAAGVADYRDDIWFHKYRPHRAGGPLHLICSMVNETIDAQRGREHRDRRGEILTVGPAGMSVGRISHGLWDANGHIRAPHPNPRPGDLPHPFYVQKAGQILSVIKGRPLWLGNWIAISGAAVTAGRGAATRWGDSLILGLANLRTGFWWDSGAEHGARLGFRPTWPLLSWARFRQWCADMLGRIFRTQLLIIFEFLGKFGGPWFRYWYVSDGGYFENLGCYELIRRRVPCIIACDAAADPKYQFEDLGNLQRKALIDFRVKIEFLKSGQIRLLNIPSAVKDHLGELADLVPNPATGISEKHAALAMITYPASGTLPQTGWLLYIKSSITGDEAMDILSYKSLSPDFPNEPTTDQVFREAQWESYRALGEHIVGKLTGQPGQPFWMFGL